MTKISILIAPPGDAFRTRVCLESLWKTLPADFDGEVLAFSPSAESLPAHPLLRAIPAGNPAGAAACRNVLARAAASPLLLFLSPGAVLLPGWLPSMLELLQRFPGAGCIGNVQREPYSGLIDHAGLRFGPDGLPTSVAHSQPALPREIHDRHPAVSFACALLKRELFDRLDGFDESFHGPLGDVDFCLRAAALGCRHYVANRSVVYHDAELVPDPFATADVARFRVRWANRAHAAYIRRTDLRQNLSAPPFAREAWEMAREERRLQRQAIRDDRKIGNTYLRKHLHRPWRYNAHRLGEAITRALHPLPPTLPPIPGPPFNDTGDLSRSDDGWLFDPPPQ